MEGKLYPAVSVDIDMIECRISAIFWDRPKEDFVFQGCLTGLATLEQPKFSTEQRPLPNLPKPSEIFWDSDDIVLKKDDQSE